MISNETFVNPPRIYAVGDTLPAEQRNQPRIFNDYGEEIFLPGTWVQAGIYRQVDTSKVIVMREAGLLPPSFDGRRAEYCRIEKPWITGPLPANSVS